MSAACAVLLLACATAQCAEVRVAVFGLFHPRELEVVASSGAVIRIHTAAAFPGPNFLLRVPGRIERRFHGRLDVIETAGELVPVVTMDLETAVASIVAAESPPGATLEALKAQAIVARSFLVAARGRHPHSDFCDTTHCQFLRELPAAGSPAAQAAQWTRGMVLRYDGRIIEALYSADCGGRTRTLAEARLLQNRYPFFAVDCATRSGIASGHRIGLCQRGAADMARAGATWADILVRYFPAAVVTSWN